MDRGSLNALPFDEASALISAHAAQLSRVLPESERVGLEKAIDRVLAQPIFADSDQPSFARSARDGYACRAVEASRNTPLAIVGATRAGQAPGGLLPANSAWEIMTGAAVPAGADAVIMVEHVEIANGPAGQAVRLVAPRTVHLGENVILQAAHAHKGDVLLAAGSVIGPAQIALAATCGHAEIDVFIRPRVAILATGDEIVPIDATLQPGQIRNSNGPMLAALVATAGGDPWILPAAADTAQALETALTQAADADLLLISGGVSAGKFDLVEPALARAGAHFHFTGLRIQPGKPTVFAELPRRSTNLVQDKNGTKCCFGLPGNPVSTAVTFLLFAAPILAALAGRRQYGPRFALAELSTPIKAKPGLTRFLPATCSFAGPVPQVTLVRWQGSGDIGAMALANCYLVVPNDIQKLDTGEIVRILLP